jgi:hypothetical protein
MATKPETGTMTIAATIAGLGAAPLTPAMIVVLVSNNHKMMIWIAA